jgi:hypothetical protein
MATIAVILTLALALDIAALRLKEIGMDHALNWPIVMPARS